MIESSSGDSSGTFIEQGIAFLLQNKDSNWKKADFSPKNPIGRAVETPKLKQRKVLTLSPNRKKVFEIIEVKR